MYSMNWDRRFIPKKSKAVPSNYDEMVNLQGAAAGVYFAKIKVGDAVVSKRVIIR